jgi:2-haloacid dehalogenase
MGTIRIGPMTSRSTDTVVAWDCYGTLFEETTIVPAALAEVASTYSLAYEALCDTFEHARVVVRRRLKYRFFLSHSERFNLIFDLVREVGGLSLEVESATALLMRGFASAAPFPEALDVVRELARSYRIGLVANGDTQCITELTRRWQLPLDFIVTSEDVQAYKPSAVIFDAVRRAAGVESERIVVVGNDLHNDVRGAQAVGMRAIWLQRDRHEQRAPGEAAVVTIKDLQELPRLLQRITAP